MRLTGILGCRHLFAYSLDYLSYDEIAVSALLGISSPSIFINTGNRKNMAQPMAPGSTSSPSWEFKLMSQLSSLSASIVPWLAPDSRGQK